MMQSTEEIRIKPPGRSSLGLGELWRHKELLYFFVWRDVKVKYKQTYLGILWAILQPALLMLIFYFIFSRTLRIDTGMSYIIFSFSGLSLWGLFSGGIAGSSESLLSNASMIRKIYFPRLLIPLSSLLAACIDFLFTLILLFILCICLGQPVSWTAVLFFPAAIVLVFFSSLGIGMLLAAANVKYRDFRYLLPFLIQLFFFSSQVVYPAGLIENPVIKKLLYLHPLNGALELFRQPFTAAGTYYTGVLISLFSALLLLTIGLRYFRKTEYYFADLV